VFNIHVTVLKDRLLLGFLVGWLVGRSVGRFIPVAPHWSIGHP
jgi:hypothetical protein